MADDTERPDEATAPDLSGPPSLRDAIRAFTTPGTDPDALLDALKASRLQPMPLGQMGKATQASAGMRWCQRCRRPEPVDAGCPNQAYSPASGPDEPASPQPGRASASLPPDPFPDTDVLAGMGIAQMLDAMEAGGVPPLRAERIIGAMLAAHGMMHKEAEGEQG